MYLCERESNTFLKSMSRKGNQFSFCWHTSRGSICWLCMIQSRCQARRPFIVALLLYQPEAGAFVWYNVRQACSALKGERLACNFQSAMGLSALSSALAFLKTIFRGGEALFFLIDLYEKCHWRAFFYDNCFLYRECCWKAFRCCFPNEISQFLYCTVLKWK